MSQVVIHQFDLFGHGKTLVNEHIRFGQCSHVRFNHNVESERALIKYLR